MADPLVACSTWTLHEAFRRGDVKASEFARIIHEKFGVTLFEYVDTHLDRGRRHEERYYEELRKSAERVGGSVCCLAVGNDFTSKAKSEREASREYVERMLDYAALLNPEGIIVRMNAGDQSFEDAALTRVQDCIVDLCEYISERGLPVRLAVENHGGITLNPDNLVRLMKHMEEKRWQKIVGLCADFGNFRREDLLDGIARMAPWVIHVHVKGFEFDDSGKETRIDVERCVRPLKKRPRYTGVWSIEYEGGGETVEAELEGTGHAIKLVKKLA